MLQLLLVAGVLYLILGDLAEASILLAFSLFDVCLVVVQEARTERALAALRSLASPRALVLRDGRRLSVPARELVVGDIIVVSEGDRVPADGVLTEAVNLEIDESLLTGESVPVRKAQRATNSADAPSAREDSACIWSGTLAVAGSGIARVVATGTRTEIGRIGTSLGQVESAPSPLHMQTRRLVRLFAAVGAGSAILLTLAHGLMHGGWLKSTLAGITLAMATLPEEFPLVLTIFLALGAWRISASRVLARRPAAVEALGAATLLCTDKTGTLTINQMSVAKLTSGDETLVVTDSHVTNLPENFHALVEFAILASRPDPFDPMERAFHDLGRLYLKDTEHLHTDWRLIRAYPLAADLLAMSQVWQETRSSAYVIAAKGAPEAVIELCHLSDDRVAAIRGKVTEMAAEGLRVLAVAKASFSAAGLPADQHEFDFALLGLVGLADPLRPGVPAAVSACASAGIQVAMITGDHPLTASAIARQAGIPATAVLTGREMAELDDRALASRLDDTRLFARVAPDQKLRLVQAFAARGEVVVMTGDGVNDAPSLKAAHIGVAMGGRGTDVAREAASLVLLDDDFTSLVGAIKLGRRIDDNLRKAFSYILAVHVPIAGMSLLPVLAGWPLLLGPIHIVFLELIIDPVSSVVFESEPEEDDLMARPPRRPEAPLFGRPLLARGLGQGAVVFLASLVVFLVGVREAHGAELSRTMTFVTLVLGNLGLIFTNRSTRPGLSRSFLHPNRSLLLVIALVAMALTIILWLPQLRTLFGFAPLSAVHLAEAAGAALACIPINQVVTRHIQALLRIA